jgi:hypothetical protein
MWKHAIGHRREPHRDLPERLAHASRRSRRALESSRLARGPGGEHRARGVQGEEHLRVHALGTLVPLLEHGLRGADANQDRDGGQRADGQPRRAAGSPEPEQRPDPLRAPLGADERHQREDDGERDEAGGRSEEADLQCPSR